MPAVPFDTLPANARVWVFASDRPLERDESRLLLTEVDGYLEQWKAHGTPLRSAREWRDNRFLAIGVDPSAEQASGCSIDALFRRLQDAERRLATSLVAGGRIFYRDAAGRPRMVLRSELPALAQIGEMTAETRVFDTTVTDARAWRERFERPARETWVGSLLPKIHESHESSRSATNASSARNG